MRYRLNESEVACEALDREVIVIHLNSGNYYSLRGSATDIWSLATSGWTVQEISDRLSNSWNMSSDTITAHVNDVIAYVSTESLILPSDCEVRQAVPINLTQDSFSAPLLQKFTDMQELLLVDPIHEVSEAGWPERNPPRQ